MEMHVLSDRRLASIAEWQRAIDIEGFPLQLSSDVRLDTAQGFLPSRLANKHTGFECYHDNAIETMKFLGQNNFGQRWAFALGLRWIGDPTELQAAWMAATAYARATGGIIFDHQEGRAFTPLQALEVIRAIERDLPAFEQAIREIAKKFAPGSQ